MVILKNPFGETKPMVKCRSNYVSDFPGLLTGRDHEINQKSLFDNESLLCSYAKNLRVLIEKGVSLGIFLSTRKSLRIKK